MAESQYVMTDEGDQVGPKMRSCVRIVGRRGSVQSMKALAEIVGPNGSLKYGYRTVKRAQSAGLLSHPDPEHEQANPHGRGAITLTEKGEELLERI